MSEDHPMTVLGRSSRTLLRRPQRGDREAFLAACQASQDLHGQWITAPLTHDEFDRWVARGFDERHDSLLVCDRESGRPAAVFNVSEIIRGPLQSAFLGYYALRPFAGTGRTLEGFGLVLRYIFVTLRLHRVEANVQPGNLGSIRLVESQGFIREGFSPRYLEIGGQWRDHARYALLREDWKSRG